MFREQSPGHITVSNPTKAFDPSNPLTPFIIYAVCTAAYPSATVSRRYSDFVWLSDQLVESQPGNIVPPLPEKQILGRFDEDFIEYRMRALEKFLNRIARHDKLRKSPFFETFLMASDASFALAKMSHQSALMTATISAVSSVTGWFGNAMNQISSPLGLSGKLVENEKTAVDLQFEEIAEKNSRLIDLMTSVREQAYEYIKASCESSVALSELSDSFQSVGEAEVSYDPALASLYSNTGVFVNNLAIEVGKEARASIVAFEEPLLEQLHLLLSVKRAIDQREAARLAYMQARQETLNAEAAHSKVVGVDSKRDQVLPRKFAFEAAQKAEKEAKSRLELISEEFLADYQRFKSEKAPELKAILLKFAQLQACRLVIFEFRLT